MNKDFAPRIAYELSEIKSPGLFEAERIIESQQGAKFTVSAKQMLNFCANNYPGLSS